jgi:hypothetical protein
MTTRLLTLLAVLSLLAVACGDDTSPVETGDGPDPSTTISTADPDSPEARLASARLLWDDYGLSSYRLTTQELCFCPETIWADTIVDSAVVSHEAVSEESFYDPGERTMDTLFDEIEEALTAGYATFEVDFDPDTGAVERYWVDVNEQMADEEHGVDVVSLEPHDETTESVEIDIADLSDDYGCGYGFAIGSPGQDLALIIFWNGGNSPDLASPVTFPSERWTGEIWVGADLFSNWCDDVIDETEPAPVVDERWTVVAGTLTFGGEAGVDCGGGAVSGTLTNAEAQSPSGETIELAELDLNNEAWGCFAG